MSDVFTCPPEHKHGKTGTCLQRHGCHCTSCLDWKTRHNRRTRQRRQNGLQGNYLHPAHRAARRLQALSALGWPTGYLARKTGLSHSIVKRIMAERYETVSAPTLVAACMVYETHSMTMPTSLTREGRAAIGRARTLATRNGWAKPLEWDDIDNDPHPAEVSRPA